MNEIEEMTLQFLRENDPLFTKKNKKKLMEYNYLSKRQTQTRESAEIPLSNLSKRQKTIVPKLGDCLDYEEA